MNAKKNFSDHKSKSIVGIVCFLTDQMHKARKSENLNDTQLYLVKTDFGTARTRVAE